MHQSFLNRLYTVRFWVAVCLLSICQTAWADDAAVTKATKSKKLSDGQFEVIHRYLSGSAEQNKWRSIPWYGDLWTARIESAKQNRPLFIWAMDGDPLGCV